MGCVSEGERYRHMKTERNIWAFVFLTHVKSTAVNNNNNKIHKTKECKIRKQ